ncbi:hypothetical protein [Pyxidicoccus trucidator]|uniref:hypothetical protein n=1 Tax=Pyxidicoccus trucidator TaxID=2709662 RepID=UPI0013DD2CA1|nr:hypothetical protein [Pyxidicoccus trucidator]
MTAQLSDNVRYLDRDFALSGVKGSGLFEPTRHGLEPQMQSTACRRGFVCIYAVSDGGLFLEELRLGLSPPEEQEVQAGRGKPLFGQAPRYVDTWDEHVVYERLHAPVAFSGGLLVASDFVRELYVHMGFHPAWKYREVHELLFEKGRLVEARDCSQTMHRVRERLREQPLGPGGSASRSEIEQWVSKTFRLDQD